MWYVIQTLKGEEERTANIIRKVVAQDLAWECFVPKRERMKKFHGGWNKVEEVLFQGYAFVDSKKPMELYEELKRVPKLTKMLGMETDFFYSLTEKEEGMVRSLGDEKHKTSLSRVIVGEGKKIQVLGGPLKGYVGNVVKTNLHKREVAVKVEFMGRNLELKMGIEMVECSAGGDRR